MSFNTWTPQGIVISGVGGAAGNPTVLYDTNPQILSANGDGKIFKMWYGPFGIYYAESNDGVTWTQYTAGSGNPVLASGTNVSYPHVYKNGSTYYLYVGSPAIDVYTSPATGAGAGITWTLAKANAIVANQTWEGGLVTQLNVVDVITVGSTTTWYGYYSGIGPNYPSGDPWTWFYMGLATSSDGVNWTKDNAHNPIIQVSTSNFCFAKVGSKYYGWSSAPLPNDPHTAARQATLWNSPLFRFEATNPNGPWTQTPTSTCYSVLETELISGGVNTCPVDPTILEVNGSTYLYYTVTVLGASRGIACDIASGVTLAQLVTGYEGVLNVPIPGSNLNLTTIASDSFASGDTNWTMLGTTGNWAGSSLAFSTGNVQPGAANTNCSALYNVGSFPNDQWATAVVKTCTGVSIVGLVVRATASGTNTPTYYLFYWYANGGSLGNSGQWALQRYVNGTYNALTSGTITANVGDSFTLAVVGSNLYVYWTPSGTAAPGFLFTQATDTNIASGAPGITIQSNTDVADAQISAWSAGGFQAAPDNGIQGALGAGGAGATVSWTGDSTGSVTADGSGNYNTGEALLPFGSYVITPSKTGYTFSPTSRSETISGSDITGVNFSATTNISGSSGLGYDFRFRF
jgi:hypothetical protein